MNKLKYPIIIFAIVVVVLLLFFFFKPQERPPQKIVKPTTPFSKVGQFKIGLKKPKVNKQEIKKEIKKRTELKPIKGKITLNEKTIKKYSFLRKKKALLLFEKEEIFPETGTKKNIKIYKTSKKYPHIRVVENLKIQDGEYKHEYSTAMVADHFVVKIKEHVDVIGLKQELSSFGITLVKRGRSTDNYLAKFELKSPNTFEEVKQLLKDRSDQLNIMPDYLVTL